MVKINTLQNERNIKRSRFGLRVCLLLIFVLSALLFFVIVDLKILSPPSNGSKFQTEVIRYGQNQDIGSR